MVIFSNTPGVVSAVITGHVMPFSIAIGGGASGAPAFPGYRLIKSILTGFTSGHQSGLSVEHTLRDRIYMYTHGERAGAATIGGIAFGGVCDDTGPRYTGIDAVVAYYERARVSSQGLPVRLIFGPRTTLVGFMTDLKIGLEDAAVPVSSFQFQFVTMPRYAGRFGVSPPLPWEDPAVAVAPIPLAEDLFSEDGA